MTALIIILCIALLILLISVLKTNTFIAFIVVSIIAALLLGMPLNLYPAILQKGIGEILG
jgi:Gnt-I system high-affinity gluconate transporter